LEEQEGEGDAVERRMAIRKEPLLPYGSRNFLLIFP
jgi:hypothetical protein